MRKAAPCWYVLVTNYDRKEFVVLGPFLEDTPIYHEAAERARAAGRDVRVQEMREEDLAGIGSWAASEGMHEACVEAVVGSEVPEAPPDEYRGPLPRYAATANRDRVVKILCKGKCGRTRWAELNRPYPGRETLKTAPLGGFQARCLRCGRVAQDNYNWYRP